MGKEQAADLVALEVWEDLVMSEMKFRRWKTESKDDADMFIGLHGEKARAGYVAIDLDSNF